MKNDTKVNSPIFGNLGIAPSLLSVLKELGLKEPTPIQEKAIPEAMSGKDLVGIAQTGTGKTLAFGIPMLQRLALHKGRGLVVLPTRELALQVEESLKKIGASFGLRTVSLIGGEPASIQIKKLKRNPHILIATPGRLIDLAQQGRVPLGEVKILVLDEADMMFDMGFAPQVRDIVRRLPQARQTMLFSATMPPSILELAKNTMTMPIKIEVAPPGTTVELVDQEMHIVRKEDRLTHLEELLRQESGSALVFVRTKRAARSLARSIDYMGHPTAEIHSDRSLGQRKSALAGFKSGKYRVLVATDIAARGIDVSGIELVVNYDLPDDPEDYVHRIGRTARAGKKGKAVSFATIIQKKEICQIEKLIRKELPWTNVSAFSPSEIARPQAPCPGRRSFSSRRRPGRILGKAR